MRRVAKTVAEAARMLGVSRQTVMAWKKKGDIKPDTDGCWDIEEIEKTKGQKQWLVRKDEEVLALAQNTNLSTKEIGSVMGISPLTVVRLKEKYKKEKPLVNFMAEKKADLLAIEQAKNHELRLAILDSISNKDVKDLGVRDKIDVYKKLGEDNSANFKDERLYRGETTENVGLIVNYINMMKEREPIVIENKQSESK